MVVRLFHRHSIIVCILVLAVVIAVTMAVNFNRSPPTKTASVKVNPSTSRIGVSSTAQPAVQATEIDNEMKAVWVPYLSLNMSRESDRSEQGFLKKFNTIVNNAKKCGMNTLIVQVRPFADALYPSSYFPWSHVVGGTQGVNPGYDPLADMVEICHREGLKIHAWINPLRIQISSTPSILAVGNVYNTWKNDPKKSDWVVDFQNGKYFNPAYAEVRRFIADGAKEIAEKYDVDGIQFDDYFYPTQDASFDQTAYDAYCKAANETGTPMGLDDWRRANISAMVSLVYREIKSVNPSLQFGIAPQGNVQNDLAMGADVTSWCSASGYVDYICPQLYVNFENPVLPFDAAAKTWRKMVTNQNIKLYYGLAVYKAGSETDSGTWKSSSDILATQVKFGREIACDGFMFYSADYLDTDQTKQEVQNVMKVLKNSS